MTDGSTEHADLLVGADGIHSRVRQLVFGPEHLFRRDLGYHTQPRPWSQPIGEAGGDVPWSRAMTGCALGGRRLLTGAVVIVLVVVMGCASDSRAELVDPDTPQVSPSGDYTAFVEQRPDASGVPSWTVVITDASGAEVFRDDDGYSAGRNHGVGVTWLTDRDQLRILSSDVGTAHVEQAASGSWTRTGITPENRDSIPQEIADLQ